MERDKNILKLFETMNSLYSIVDVLEKEIRDKQGKIESEQGLFKCIAQQTTECYYFIREYVKTEGFGEFYHLSNDTVCQLHLHSSKANSQACNLIDG